MSAPLNVLLITADQMRQDHMGCYGNGVVRTPNLDSLAGTGVRLDRAYVNNPLCMPNRATLATGRLPRNHGVWCNGITLPQTQRTVADVLNERGYHTALLGKGHLSCFGVGPDRQSPYYDSRAAWRDGVLTPDWTGPYYGFNDCRIIIGHSDWRGLEGHYAHWLRERFPQYVSAPSQRQPSPIGSLQCFTPPEPPEAHASTWLGEIGADYLRARAADGRPFFCWVSFPDPHHPFCPPEPYASMYDPATVPLPRFGPECLDDKPPQFRRAYEGGLDWEGIGKTDILKDVAEPQLREIIARTYGMISLLDQNVGRLLAALQATGLAENTVVIFTSDHGDLMGDCGLIFKGPFLLEGLVRVPMLWRVPGTPAGRCGDGLFTSADVVPTVLELLNVPAPREIDGLAQAELVRGGAGRRSSAVVEFRSMYNPELNLRSLVTAQRKLTHYPGLPYGELYDMTAPVPEARNLYHDPAHAAERAALEQTLLDESILNTNNGRWPICHA